mmetsp:Transcript_51142/g.101766  ORF Transcript_51142/g.101766 Transcript_51142/m.101766 type:complete len:158 (-) Transcript_51142:1253-1726(-)
MARSQQHHVAASRSCDRVVCYLWPFTSSFMQPPQGLLLAAIVMVILMGVSKSAAARLQRGCSASRQHEVDSAALMALANAGYLPDGPRLVRCVGVAGGAITVDIAVGGRAWVAEAPPGRGLCTCERRPWSCTEGSEACAAEAATDGPGTADAAADGG